MVTSVAHNDPVSVSPRRRLPAAERGALIEAAAARLFAERGYGATTVADIAAEAGVSKPMLYRHFESKKQLQLALLERRRDELAAAPLDEFLRHAGAPDEQLPAMIEAWLTHVEEHPHTSRILFRDAVGDADVEDLQRRLRARQRAADVALLREIAPALPEDELEPLGEIVRSSLTGVALWWLDHPDTPRAVVGSALLRMTLGVLSSAL
jgi:AcrR family transcriptional regulator